MSDHLVSLQPEEEIIDIVRITAKQRAGEYDNAIHASGERSRARESQVTRERTQQTYANEVDIQLPSPAAPLMDPTIADGCTFESF
jgi:hypothetical protein